MNESTLGRMIAALRKENGMTQLELAQKLGVTDKAVSKWERDLSCPDINSLPKLAEIFGVSVDELMRVKSESKKEQKRAGDFIGLVCRAVSLAMGIAVVALSVMKEIDMYSGFSMLGVAAICVAILLFQKNR